MPDEIDPENTVSEAKGWLRERVDEGECCPVCTQFAKVYRRQVHSTMARVLVLAYRSCEQDWFQLSSIEKQMNRGGSSEAGKLRYWGLLQEEIEKRPDGGRSGWWRITDTGAAFVLDRSTIQKYALIYDGRCLGLDGPHINIRDALGKKFNYNQLMAGN